MKSIWVVQISVPDDEFVYRYVLTTNVDYFVEHGGLRKGEEIDSVVEFQYLSDIITNRNVELFIPSNDLGLHGTISEGWVELN